MASFRRFGDSIEVVQADACVEISEQVLEQGDPAFVSVSDGMVTFHCSNADISYALVEHDDLREVWLCVRSDLAEENEQ